MEENHDDKGGGGFKIKLTTASVGDENGNTVAECVNVYINHYYCWISKVTLLNLFLLQSMT